MAVTMPGMLLSMRRSSRSSPESPYVCRHAARRAPPGIRKDLPSCIAARAGLDASGRVVAYSFHGKGFSRQDVVQVEADPKDTLAGQLTGWKPKGNLLLQTPAELYEFENKRCSWETIPPLLDRASPLRTGHLRDPLGPETHFASESFIDEVAQAAGADPVQFRLRYLKDERHAAVIEAVAEKARWKDGRNANRGKGDVMAGRGVSYTERNGTVVAVIAEVEVDRRSGRVWAKKFTVAHDCGQIINPATLEADDRRQRRASRFPHAARGSALRRESRHERRLGELSELELADAPEAIDIVLIDRPNMPPQGAGEPSTRTVPAAIANAIFDATGVRMWRVPITPKG